jgi:hypothetical protein
LTGKFSCWSDRQYITVGQQDVSVGQPEAVKDAAMYGPPHATILSAAKAKAEPKD